MIEAGVGSVIVARLTSSNTVFIGSSPLALRRLYTAIFEGPWRRQDARSSRDSGSFDWHVSSRASAATRRAEPQFAIDCARPAAVRAERCQVSKMRYRRRRRFREERLIPRASLPTHPISPAVA